jgi:hypothetical protein
VGHEQKKVENHCFRQNIDAVLNKNFQDLKVCDDGILIPLLVFWTLSIVQSLFKNNVSTMDNVQKTNNGKNFQFEPGVYIAFSVYLFAKSGITVPCQLPATKHLTHFAYTGGSGACRHRPGMLFPQMIQLFCISLRLEFLVIGEMD